MRIGILGSGNIGGTLGQRLSEVGHDILIGVRDPNSPKAQAAAGTGLKLGTIAEAAEHGEIVVVALPLNVIATTLPELPLAGKIVIDTTNAFGGAPAGFASAAAVVAAAAPQVRHVKAFNSGPWETIANPQFHGKAIETFICGDDVEAREVVAGLAESIGMTPVIVGGIALSGLTENLAWLWGSLAFGGGLGRNFAFTLVQR